jgi:hypothetical protein
LSGFGAEKGKERKITDKLQHFYGEFSAIPGFYRIEAIVFKISTWFNRSALRFQTRG